MVRHSLEESSMRIGLQRVSCPSEQSRRRRTQSGTQSSNSLAWQTAGTADREPAFGSDLGTPLRVASLLRNSASSLEFWLGIASVCSLASFITFPAGFSPLKHFQTRGFAGEDQYRSPYRLVKMALNSSSLGVLPRLTLWAA